jgi:hypothetical protein
MADLDKLQREIDELTEDLEKEAKLSTRSTFFISPNRKKKAAARVQAISAQLEAKQGQLKIELMKRQD